MISKRLKWTCNVSLLCHWTRLFITCTCCQTATRFTSHTCMFSSLLHKNCMTYGTAEHLITSQQHMGWRWRRETWGPGAKEGGDETRGDPDPLKQSQLKQLQTWKRRKQPYRKERGRRWRWEGGKGTRVCVCVRSPDGRVREMAGVPTSCNADRGDNYFIRT